MARVTVLGVPVEAVDLAGLLGAVQGLVESGAPATVGYVNVHVLEMAARDPRLLAWLRGLDLCYADGQGVVLAARAGGGSLPGRLTGADWILPLVVRAAAQGWRVAWIGGRPGVVDRAVARLRAAVPALDVVHTDHGYRARYDLAALASARPDLTLVGMGTPVQERWVAVHRERVPGVVWALGATADFVSGEVSRGPAWLHQRQEWAARLWVDPGRLWRRYLLGNPRFALRVARELGRR